MKMLTQAYQEHALEQINFARYSVLSSREFMEELTEIFFNVKLSYESFLATLIQKDKAKQLAKLKKNGKEVLVLVSANGKFYGDIINRTSRLFYERALTEHADLVIIGKDGKRFCEQAGLTKPYTYFELSDTAVSLELLKPIIQLLVPYEKVTVFYGKFDNIVLQEAVEASLSGDMPKDNKTTKPRENFLFEPSIANVMEFFETQIFSLLLNQTMNDSKLARFASRVKAMESAQENLQKQLKILAHKELRFKASDINKKQLQLFAGRSLWGKR